ncbi:hypothetical protein Ocin01_19555 [Orchesella cincta]|uniref:Uncharacterized protein n=1 Tax=Orchesella cincta TaxID=48709 RepID=A0A1D2M2D3_ORCCI|nr:hypothetical protein Ocin01_19555 [Orchesella cincta]
MLLAWDRLDEAFEQLRCYLFMSYEQTRPATLRMAQRDLKTAELFNGSSITLGQPCVNLIYADNATGSWSYSLTPAPHCTLENNEICAPRPLSQFEEPDDPLRGGISVLKPKWVFRTDSAHGECKGHRTWVIQQFACRCGFRTDCGDDLLVNISCPLQPKDWEDRRQCRGSVGYPCRTLPLAPGKHNESCVSEYCDMEENSCEDRPWFKRRSGAMASPYRTLALSYWMMNIIILMIAL